MQCFNLTKKEFLTMLPQMQHGDRLVYHVGYLFGDRQAGTDWETVNTGRVHSLAAAVFTAAEEGSVKLFQRKLEPSIYQYIAIRQHPPKPLKWTGCYDPGRSTYTGKYPSLREYDKIRKARYRENIRQQKLMGAA